MSPLQKEDGATDQVSNKSVAADGDDRSCQELMGEQDVECICEECPSEIIFRYTGDNGALPESVVMTVSADGNDVFSETVSVGDDAVAIQRGLDRVQPCGMPRNTGRHDRGLLCRADRTLEPAVVRLYIPVRSLLAANTCLCAAVCGAGTGPVL